jgi:hypothetical protein
MIQRAPPKVELLPRGRNTSLLAARYDILGRMKTQGKAPARRNVRIVVNDNDPRMATVMHDDTVIFTIKTDVSGMHPSIIVVATETHLKSMEKGKTGITLWNGTA